MRTISRPRRFAGYLACLVIAVAVVQIAAQDRNADELRALQGTWIVTAGEQGGKPFDAIRGGTLSIKDATFSLRTAAENEFTGELKIDPSTSPRRLDFVHTNGTVWEAIYSISGDSFRLNYVEAGGRDKRPTVFATTADLPGLLVVMKRK